jgi:hypothetical protein
MLFYIECPSCSRNLTKDRALYQKKADDIRSDPKLSEEEKSERYAKLIKSMGLITCCNPRVMGTLNYHEIIRS